MASVEITISGVLYDKTQRTTQPVVLIGEASLTGLSVGGGPIQPPAQQPPSGQPPHPAFPIWGPPGSNFPDKPGYPPEIGGGPIIPPEQPPSGKPPIPVFPIWGPPGITLPPGSGYPPVAGHPLPTPPDGGSGEPPKPIVGWEAKAVWSADTGWAVIIVPKDETLVPTPSKAAVPPKK